MNLKGIKDTIAMALIAASASASAGAAFAEPLPFYIGTMTSRDTGSQGIYRSALDPATGALAEPVLAAEATDPSFLAIHPDRNFLYAANTSRDAGAVNAFAIDAASGDLLPLGEQPSRGAVPCYVNLDPTGRWLLTANYGSGSVASLPILPDGALGAPAGFVQHEGAGPHPRRQQGPHAHSIYPTPDGRFILAADLGIDKILIYRLDSETGALTPNDPAFGSTPPGAGPRHLAFHPNGKFIYAINEVDSTMTAFAYDGEAGALTEIQTVPALPESFEGTSIAAEVCIHPGGKFLYGSNRGHDSIVVYRIDPEQGTLTLVEHETADIRTPRNFVLDPTGTFCLVANMDGDSVIVFRIDPATGALEPTGHKIAVPAPVCLRFMPPMAE